LEGALHQAMLLDEQDTSGRTIAVSDVGLLGTCSTLVGMVV